MARVSKHGDFGIYGISNDRLKRINSPNIQGERAESLGAKIEREFKEICEEIW